MPSREELVEFIAWCGKNVTGDEKGQAQIFPDRLFQAFGHAGCLNVGRTTEFRVRKSDEDGGGTAFADYVWKPVVLVEMKKRGGNSGKNFAHPAKSAGELAGTIEKKQSAADSVLLKSDLSLSTRGAETSAPIMRRGCAGGLPGICGTKLRTTTRGHWPGPAKCG
jgi:hypothetical protein